MINVSEWRKYLKATDIIIQHALLAKKSEYGMKEIISIRSPYMEKNAGNKQAKTFDTIRVEIVFASCIKDIESFVRQNKSKINACVIEFLNKNSKYMNFGVPTSYLKLFGIGVAKNGSRALFQYCLKDFDVEENDTIE